MKKVVAGLLLVGALSFGLGAASPSFAGWREDEVKLIEEQQKRRAEELAKTKSEQEARDRASRMQYEEQRKKDLERRIYYHNKYGN